MLIVDAQIHLFGPGGEERAARIGQTALPAEQIVARMDQAGVDRAYLVPAGSGANEACLDAVREWPDRFRVMGILALNKPESRDLVADWKGLGYHGVRLSFPPFRDPSWLRDGTADWFWPEAERCGVPVMIWAPEQFSEVAEIARNHPRLKLTVDHLGLYVEDKGEATVRVVNDLLPLAELPNVAVKASALPAHSQQGYPFSDIAPAIAAALQSFGADRVFWGTDFTRLPCTLQEAVLMFTEELEFLHGDELEKVMGRAITQWIGW